MHGYGYDYGTVVAYQVAIPGGYIVYAEQQDDRHVLWGFNAEEEREGIGAADGDPADAIRREVAGIRARNRVEGAEGFQVVELGGDEQLPATHPGFLTGVLTESAAPDPG